MKDSISGPSSLVHSGTGYECDARSKEKGVSSKDIKWSAIPLPCYIYLIKIVSYMQGSGPGRGRNPVE